MALRNNFSLLLFFSLLLLLFSSKICRATESHDCPPSSCGSIQNISYPFRLKGDPKNCGDPGYELVCENNRTTIYLNSKRFFVQSITYRNFTIRLVDPGLENYHGYSSCPFHYLTYYDISGSYDTYDVLNKFLIYILCAAHLNTTLYYETTAYCSDYKNNLSNSPSSVQQNYSYYSLRDSLELADIEDSCSVKRITLVSTNAPVVGNSQLSNFSYGFELKWYGVLCRSCWNEGAFCHLRGKTTTVTVVCGCSILQPSTIRLASKCK